MFPTSIKCPISNCTHKVVYKDQNKTELKNYCESIIDEIDRKKRYAYFAIDLEGKAKFEAIDDIGMIQFARFWETKSPHVIKYDENKLNVKLRDGFIIIEPDDDVKNILSKLFNYTRVCLVFFSIWRDLSSLWNHGIKFFDTHAIDTQTRNGSFKYSLSLAAVIKGLDENVQFSAAAKDALTLKTGFNHAEKLLKQQSLTEEEALQTYNEELQYASNDIIFTALSAIEFLKYYKTLSAGKAASRKRTNQFSKLYQRHPYLPIVKTQLEFSKKAIISGNINQPSKLWSNIYQILPYCDVIKDHLPNIEITREMLEQVKQKCEEMMQKGIKDAATQQTVDQASVFTVSFESILDGFKINGELRELFIDSSKDYFSANRDPKQIFSEICKEIDEATKSNPGETYELFQFCKDDNEESREATYNDIYNAFMA